MKTLANNPSIIVSKMTVFCAALMCVLMLLQTVNAQIYKTVNSDGSVTYSDKPSNNGEEVIINTPTSTFESTTPALLKPPQVFTQPKVQYRVDILSPQQDATIRNNVGELSIGAAIEPRIGGFFQLLINGQVHESATGMFRLTNMERGAYTYSIKFINNSGKVIASSESRNVFLHQASALIN